MSRGCAHCGASLPTWSRPSKRYCNNACRVRASRSRPSVRAQSHARERALHDYLEDVRP